MSDESDRTTDADQSEAPETPDAPETPGTPDGDLPLDDPALDADQAAQIEAAMAEARARLAGVPPEVVIVNHVMGMYELAAIHLSAQEPDLRAAALAIDAMAAVVDRLGDRLGEDAPTMNDALANIRMAFVGVRAQSGPAPG